MMNFILNVFIFLIFFSCSTQKGLEPVLITKVPERITQKKIEYLTGPTQSIVNGQFIEVSKKYGLEGVKAVHLYSVDFNNDHHDDLVVLPDFFSSPEFFQFNPLIEKFERLNYNPLGIGLMSSFLLFTDHNKDGVQDLFSFQANQKSSLGRLPIRFFHGHIKNSKITYKEVKNIFPNDILGPMTAALIDFDLDGDLDLFLGNWLKYDSGHSIAWPDRLLSFNGSKFVDETFRLFSEGDYNKELDLYSNAAPTLGASLCDVDLNGYPDLVVSSSSGFYNKLWLNLKFNNKNERIFKDYGKSSGFASDKNGILSPRSGGNTFFSTCADYNNDGIIDIAVGEQFHAYDSPVKDRSAILTGKTFFFPPEFIRSDYIVEEVGSDWKEADREAMWSDFNNDSLTDLFVLNSGYPPNSRLIVFKQEIDNSFRDESLDLGMNILNPAGIIKLDINNDGKLDYLIGQNSIRASEMSRQLYFFKNNNKNNFRSLTLYLEGQKSNSEGIGAKVVVHTNKGLLRKIVSKGSGSLPSQSSKFVHFGLEKRTVKIIEVRWPILVNQYPHGKSLLNVSYDISKIPFKENLELTLCENGRFFAGQNKKCRE